MRSGFFGRAGGVFTSPAMQVLNNLVAWWDCEESSGTILSDTHSTKTLTTNANMSAMSTASGKVGRAIDIDTTGEYAYAAGSVNDNFKFGTGSFTVFLWHYRLDTSPAPGGYGYLISRYRTAGNQRSYRLGVDASVIPTKYEFAVSTDGNIGGTFFRVFGPDYGVSGSWDFIAAGYDAGAGEIFIIVNGTKFVTPHTGGVFAGATSRFAIGTSVADTPSDTAGPKGGRYDSMGVMSSAINMDQYNILYNAGNGRNYAQLVAAAF